MSAYICSPEHIAALAAFASRPSSSHVIIPWKRERARDTVRNVARRLAEANIKSVAERYPNDQDGNRPGPCMTDEEICKASERYAGKYLVYPPKLSPLDIISMASCYEYQACEAENYATSDAALQIGWIKDAAIRSLNGYDKAVRDYHEPELEAA